MNRLRKDTSLTGDPLLLRVADELADEEYRACTEGPGELRGAVPPPTQITREEQAESRLERVEAVAVILIMLVCAAARFFS